MKFYRVIALVLSLGVYSSANASSRNEEIMYGNTPPSAAEKVADDKFIADAVKMKGSREAASDKSVQLGFMYLLQKNDPTTAMKRFNQGYLLDPNNGAVYQGMAITTIIRDQDKVMAEKLFQKAASSARVNPDIFADYARFLLQEKRPSEAIPILEHGLELDKDYAETNSLLAVVLYESDRKLEACPMAKQWQSKSQPMLADRLKTIIADPICH